MKKIIISFCFISLCLFLSAQETAIKNVTIIDVKTGKVLYGQSILIKNELIAWTGPNKNLKIKSETQEIDATGKFIIPGLIDAHIHFFQSGSLYTRPDIIDFRSIVPYKKEKEFAIMNSADYLSRYLRLGITTVIDVGGPFSNFSIRDSISKLHLSPNVLATGPLFSMIETPQLGPEDLPIIKVTSTNAVDSLFRKMIPNKPDFIKVWYIANEEIPAEKNFPLVKYIGEQAKKNNLKLAVHATELKTARLAIDAGASILVHSIEDEVIPDDFVRRLKENNVTYIPTMIVEGNYYKAFAGKIGDHEQDLAFANSFALASMKDFETMDSSAMPPFVHYLRKNGIPPLRTDSIRKLNLVKLFKAGVNIATGTDAGNIGTFHASSYMLELEAMKQAGLTNSQILMASTINAATGFGKEQKFGSIETGKLADLLLLSKNPLENIENINSAELIFKNGKAIKPDTLINESPEAVVQRQVNAYNARNIEAFINTYAEDIEIFNSKNIMIMKGHDEMRIGYTDFFRTTTNLHCEIENRIVINNKIIDKEKVRAGTGLIRGVAIYEVENGKIKKVTFLE